jgi:hypothetical protein
MPKLLNLSQTFLKPTITIFKAYRIPSYRNWLLIGIIMIINQQFRSPVSMINMNICAPKHSLFFKHLLMVLFITAQIFSQKNGKWHIDCRHFHELGTRWIYRDQTENRYCL